MEKKEICPNPNGEEGICYSYDRFGDRTGCLGCPLADTIPNGVFGDGDPLPGLTRKIKRDTLLSQISVCSQYEENCPSEIKLGKEDCKLLLEIINDYVDRMTSAVSKINEGIQNTQSAINFYKENQINKDDFSSELHLLLVRAVNLDDILKAIEGSSAPSLDWLYNDHKKEERNKMDKLCCICGEKFTGFGNNPYPLTDDVNARCCNECNSEYVIPARILNIKPDEKEKIKSLINGELQIEDKESM